MGDIIGETVVKAADMKHAAHYDTAKVYISTKRKCLL